MKIIIVDDEASALHVFLDEIINCRDVDYKFFSDEPEQVLQYAEARRPDAAFLDIRMPKIEGTELARQLIEICPDIKIVFITGLSVNEKNLPSDIRANTLGFIYKPYDRDKLTYYLDAVSDTAPQMRVATFDTFACYINGRPLEFTSTKSKELFALLIAYCGKTLTMSDAISQLWPDHDSEKAKILYRDAVWRLRKVLQNANFNCVNFSRGELVLNRDNIVCDFWDCLNGKNSEYHGEFLKCYDWSVDYLALLDAAGGGETDVK